MKLTLVLGLRSSTGLCGLSRLAINLRSSDCQCYGLSNGQCCEFNDGQCCEFNGGQC